MINIQCIIDENNSSMDVLKDYRVWMLFICYAICFGVELTFYLQAAYWFRQQFGFNEITSGVLVVVWSSMNLPARPFGGYYCDRYQVQRRVYILWVVLFMEGIFTLLFGSSLEYNYLSFGIIYTVIMMLLFSWTVQMAEGVVFSIVPFIKPLSKEQTGMVMGIVGCGGNVGAVLFTFCIFLPFTKKRIAIDNDDDMNINDNDIDNNNMFNPWMIMGLIIMLLSFSSLFIRFSAQEDYGQINREIRARNGDIHTLRREQLINNRQTD